MPSSRKQPEAPPEFLVDRSIGQTDIPEALRAIPNLNLTVHTLTTVYGANGMTTDDEIWIEEAGKQGWVVLTADQGITHVEIERVAFLKAKIRAFRLPRGDLPGAVQVGLYVMNIHRIIQKSRKRGPALYVVLPHKPFVKYLWP